MPIAIPAGVDVSITADQVVVKGALGTLTLKSDPRVALVSKDGVISCSPVGGEGDSDAMVGTTRALVANMVEGVSKGFERRLSLVGVGFRAQAQGDQLNLQIGFSHPVVKAMPAGVKVAAPTPTEIVVSGADVQAVGQIAAEIRAVRPPEPYKGKGIRYVGEKIVLKETKKK
jgi:large subunit ribosomal protein L6